MILPGPPGEVDAGSGPTDALTRRLVDSPVLGAGNPAPIEDQGWGYSSSLYTPGPRVYCRSSTRFLNRTY